MRILFALMAALALHGCYLDTSILGGTRAGAGGAYRTAHPGGGEQEPPGSDGTGAGVAGMGTPSFAPRSPAPGPSGDALLPEPDAGTGAPPIEATCPGITCGMPDATVPDAVVAMPQPDAGGGTAGTGATGGTAGGGGEPDAGPGPLTCDAIAPGAPQGDPWFFAPAFDCAEDGSIPCTGARVESMGGNVYTWCSWSYPDAPLAVPASDVVLWHTHAPTMVVGATKCTRFEYGGDCYLYRGKDQYGDADVEIKTWQAPTAAPGWVTVSSTTKVGGTLEGACTISCP